jgi:hypothetical protein
MESLDRRLLLTGAGIAGLAAVSAAAKAGSLNPPPGPVAPTGKSTTEIEPRTAVQSLLADATAMKVINQPGSYYLTGNLAGGAAGAAGIAIAASNVTLDLCGFAVTGAAGMTSGIELRGALSNVRVRDGSLANWPVAGVKALAGGTRNILLERLAVSDCPGAGIDLASGGPSLGAAVTGCAVAGCGGGINVAIDAGVVENCQVTQVSATTSVSGIAAGTVRGCTVSGVVGPGASSVYGIRGDAIAECAVREVHSGGGGVSTGISGNTVTGCAVFGVSRNSSTGVGQGISGRTVANCLVEQVGGSTSTSIQYGIAATGLVTGCTVSFVGNSSASSLARGINTEVAENCRVFQVNTLSTLVGILATYMARGCSISSMNQLGTGAGSVTGIETGSAIDCQVDSINGNTGSLVTGIIANRLASACSVMSVENAGAGGAVSINAVAGAQVTGCMVGGGGGTGIRCLGVTKVTGCQVADATIGIDCGAGSLVDGNNVSGSTTGIKTTGASTVVRNHVTGATTAYNVAVAGQPGPIVSATGTIASTSPWANFQG